MPQSVLKNVAPIVIIELDLGVLAGQLLQALSFIEATGWNNQIVPCLVFELLWQSVVPHYKAM